MGTMSMHTHTPAVLFQEWLDLCLLVLHIQAQMKALPLLRWMAVIVLCMPLDISLSSTDFNMR